MATWYVRPTNGLDTNGGQSFGDAYQTFQKAIDSVATDGDEIRLCNEANEQPSAAVDFDMAFEVLVRAGNSTDGTPLTSGYYTLDGTSLPATTNLFNLATGDHCVIERVHFTNATSNNIWCTVTSQTRFVNCRISGAAANGYHGDAGDQGTTTFIGCEIDGNTSSGITSWGVARGASNFHYCTVHDNGSSGIESGKYAPLASHCLVYDNGGSGIRFDSGSGGIIWNNTMERNGASGFLSTGGIVQIFNNCSFNNTGYGFNFSSTALSKIISYNNLTYNNSTAATDVNGGTMPGYNNLTADPRVISTVNGSEDYRPGPGSPLNLAGIVSAYQAGGNNYIDLGAIQDLDSPGLPRALFG